MLAIDDDLCIVFMLHIVRHVSGFLDLMQDQQVTHGSRP